MGIIQCSESCKFQQDGYCSLDKCSVVSSTEKGCPYFVSRLADNGDCLGKTSHTDKFQ